MAVQRITLGRRSCATAAAARGCETENSAINETINENALSVHTMNENAQSQVRKEETRAPTAHAFGCTFVLAPSFCLKLGREDSALMAALRAYQSAYRLAPTTAMLDIWRLKGKMDALEALLGKKRSERARGTPPSSSPGGGGGRGGGFRTPPPPAAAAAHSEGTADGGGACNEKPLPGDAFTLLGLDIRTCTKLDVKKSYRQRAREYHPDKYKGVKRCAEMHFIRLKDAYDTTLGKCQ